MLSDVQTGAPIVQPHPWYRRWRLILPAILLVVGLPLGLVFGLTSSGTSGSDASGILKGDGYTVAMVLSPSQLSALVASSKHPTAGLVGELCDSGAMGVKGTSEEVALHVSSSGKRLIAVPGFVSDLASGAGKGVTARVEGDFVVLAGPMGS